MRCRENNRSRVSKGKKAPNRDWLRKSFFIADFNNPGRDLRDWPKLTIDTARPRSFSRRCLRLRHVPQRPPRFWWRSFQARKSGSHLSRESGVYNNRTSCPLTSCFFVVELLWQRPLRPTPSAVVAKALTTPSYMYDDYVCFYTYMRNSFWAKIKINVSIHHLGGENSHSYYFCQRRRALNKHTFKLHSSSGVSTYRLFVLKTQRFYTTSKTSSWGLLTRTQHRLPSYHTPPQNPNESHSTIPIIHHVETSRKTQQSTHTIIYM